MKDSLRRLKDSLCRFCQAILRYTFVDLGVPPLANSFLKPAQLQQMEPFYPLLV